MTELIAGRYLPTSEKPNPLALPEPLYECAQGKFTRSCQPAPADQLHWFAGMRTMDGRESYEPGWTCASCIATMTLAPNLLSISATPTLAEYQQENFAAAARRARLIGRPLIYVASPFTPTLSDDESVRESRVRDAGKIAALMIRAGISAIAPIPHYEAGARAYHDGPLNPPDGYYEYDLRILRRCDGVVLIELDGWTRSVGIRKELDEAERLGMPVARLHPADIEPLSRHRQDDLMLWTEQRIREKLSPKNS